MKQETEDTHGVLVTVTWHYYADEFYPMKFHALVCCLLMVSFFGTLFYLIYNWQLCSSDGIIAPSHYKACSILIMFCLYG